MKKFLTGFLALIILLSMATVASAAPAEVIKYDFESETELNDWQAFGGSWKIEEGCLKQTSGTPGSWNMHLALKDVTLKDFTVRMRMKVTKESLGTGWAALYFRKLNLGDNQEQSGYGLTIEGKSSKGKTVVVDWAHSSKTFEDECKSNPGEWNDIVLQVSGNEISIYFNDDIASKTPTMVIVDADNGWTEAGYMSLAAGNAKIDVDYFYLYSGKSQDQAFAGASVENPTEPTDPTPTQTEPVETKPVETKPVETKPVETKPVETKPVETKPVETKPVETKPVETKPVETKPVETKPVETKPVETKPVETKPVETNPIETVPSAPPETSTPATEPSVEPSVAPETSAPITEPPTVPATSVPTQPQQTDSDGEDPGVNWLSIVLVVIGVGGIGTVVTIYLIGNKRKAH